MSARDRKKKTTRLNKHVAAAASLVATAQDARMSSAAEIARRGTKDVKILVRQYGNASKEQIAGRVAEIHHASTFNADAAAKGLRVRASTTASLGKPGASGDLIASAGREIVARGEVKYHRNCARSGLAAADGKYTGQQRILPSDQVVAAKNILGKSASRKLASRPGKAAVHAETAAMIDDRFRAGGASSKPLSAREAAKLAKNPKKIQTHFREPGYGDVATSSLKSGALFSGTVSVLSNVSSVRRGEKTVGDAVGDSVIDLVIGTSKSVVVGVAGKATGVALTKVGLKSLAKTSAPATIAMSALEMTGDIAKFVRGELSGDDLAKSGARTAVRGGTSFAGAELGGIIGTAVFPGAGTVVGMVVGGLLGGVFGQKLTS